MNEQLTQIYGYLHGMWRYRWSALIVTWIVAIIGWPLVFSLPDQFSAKAVVYVDTSSVLKPLLKGLTPDNDSLDELRVMSRVLLSRQNLLSVIRETDMDLEVDSQSERENMILKLAGDIKIKVGGKGKDVAANNIYEIRYSSSSAERAYKVVSNFLNTMIENTMSSTRIDTIAAQKFIETQIAEYEQRLSIDEQKLAEFKKTNIGLMPNEKGGYYTRLQRARETQASIKSKLNLAQRRYTQLNKQLKGESPILSRDSYRSSVESKIKQYQNKRDLLLNQYTEQHPDVRSLDAIIEDLKTNRTTDLVNEDSTVSGTGAEEISEFNPVYQQMKVELNKAGIEIEALKTQLQEQKNRVAKLQGSMDIIPQVEAQLSKLNRDYGITRKRYLSLVERRESAELGQKAGMNSSEVTFRVIDPPIVPYRPSGPNRILFLFGVLMASMAAGLAWSFIRYILQPTFIELRQLELVTGLPVIGSVSLYLSPKHINKRRLQLTSFVSATFLLVLVFGVVMWYQQSGTAFFGALIARI